MYGVDKTAKNGDFRPISRFISETMEYNYIVTMED